MPVMQKRTKKVHRKKSSASRPPEGHVRPGTKVRPTRYFRWKELVERVVAVILLLPGLPLIGLLMLLVRLHSARAGRFSAGPDGQERRGSSIC